LRAPFGPARVNGTPTAEKVVKDGVEMTTAKEVEVQYPVTKWVPAQWHADKDRATAPDGTLLSKEVVFKRLTPGTAVLVMPGNVKLSPAQQRLFSKDAVILMLPGSTKS